ncbi:hypothetical protein F5148DRAFT_102214 [Russula earlei]|uniref:Uncharacterized protein n=1 Tax=Russula earlei TaxID=71964 RepID=A0ACC0U8Z2_9AGAM|nr:hypothetical protein F5148DRAFT_102214 [Russula earlei]
MALALDANAVLTYLGLPLDYEPSPTTAPVTFLTKHIHQLPSHILHWFSAITTPQQRAGVVLIRNRRFNFILNDPPEFSFPTAKRQWPTLWEGPQRIGHEEAQEEKEWAKTSFLGGEGRPFVGKLGTLLGGYEEERHLERGRQARLDHQDVVPEEDENSEDDRDRPTPGTPESEQTLQESFLRRVRERFIYGHLECDLYDTVDWDYSWDREDREAEDRWFDDE